MPGKALPFFILGMLVLLAACGGGAHPVAPVFTSTAPQAAAEGATYSYRLSATANGTPATYTLTTAPTGAVLQDDTVVWTPTAAQARVPNLFTVTATAGALSSTQSWTVTPNGTIRVSDVNTRWTAQGTVTEAIDMLKSSDAVVQALLPQTNGALRLLPGSRNADGSVSIPNVPAGYYWLQLGDTFENHLFWTNGNSFDFGSDVLGRNSYQVASSTVTVAIDGLDSWQPWAGLDLLCPNARRRATLAIEAGCIPVSPLSSCPPVTPTLGTTTLNEVYTIAGYPVDPVQGDTCYLAQYEPFGTRLISPWGSVLGTALSLPPVALTNGSTANLTATMSTANPQSLDFNINGSAFQAISPAQAGPLSASDASSAFGIIWTYLVAQPFVTDRVAAEIGFAPSGGVASDFQAPNSGWPVTLVNLQTESLADQDLGPIQYQNPFPSTWLPVLDVIETYCVPAGATSNTQSYNVCGGAGSLTANPTGLIAPLMSPVQNPTLNGLSLFSVSQLNTTTPALTWQAPTGLKPSGYAIFVSPADTTGGIPSTSLFTTGTSLTIPPGFLAAGNTYQFVIQALANGRSDYMTSPNRATFPYAFSQATSRYVTIGTTSTAAHSTAAQPQSSQQTFRLFDSHGRLHTITR